VVLKRAKFGHRFDGMFPCELRRQAQVAQASRNVKNARTDVESDIIISLHHTKGVESFCGAEPTPRLG
jgi:hypothetical protein